MRAPPALVPALAMALLAGCLATPGADPQAEHGFSGVFLSTVLPGEIFDLADRVRAEGGEFASDGKIPPSFLARGLTRDACDVVHLHASTKLYIARLDPCAPLELPETAPLPPTGAAIAADDSVIASMPVG